MTQPFPDFGLTDEQRRQAVFGHYYEWPGMDGEKGEIWCYSDRISYRAGEKLALFISSTAERCDLRIERDGAALVPVWQQSGIVTRWQETPDQSSVDGCGWEKTWEFVIPADWTSGAYRITLSATGRNGSLIISHHLFIVVPAAGAKPGRILQVAATGTWLAYNTWGGSNHYQGITGANRDQFSPIVSRERPWCRGFITLPADAPRVPLPFNTPILAEPPYPHMEWAFATGHSKKYASSGWASYDGLFFRWAEQAGYAIDLCSQQELQDEPELLNGYDCVVFVGHDEYWTWEMRDAVEAYVGNGGHVARFAGNFMWQTRLVDGGRQQVCYKYRARAEDPVYQTADKSRATTSWEAPEIGRAGAKTFGLNATYGLYAGWGGCAPRGVRGFPIYRPEHWAFRNTGLYYGDILGADSQIFGYEVDGLAYEIRGGLPFATGEGDPPAGLSILALGVSSLVEENADLATSGMFLNDEDLRFVAEALAGNDQPATLDRFKRGCGMIVHFNMGAGEVFHAGSCEWVAGLKRNDAMVEQVTRNVLNRFLDQQTR